MRLLAVSPAQAVLDSVFFVGFIVALFFGMWVYYGHTARKVRKTNKDIAFLRKTISMIESDLVLADQDDTNVQRALFRIYNLNSEET